MKKSVKISVIILATLIVLISLMAGILTFLIDPNKFKGKLSQYVFAKTGQVLVINGNMHWSFLPWIGIKANNLAYYNPPGFQPKTLASAKEMDIKIKFLPLIKGNVEIGNITFDHLVLNLVKNSQGHYNWQATKTKDDEKEAAKSSDTARNLNPLAKMMINSFKIKDGTVHWYDQKENQGYTLNNFNLLSKKIAIQHSFPLSMSFIALDKNGQNIADIDMNSKLTINPNSKQYVLQNVKLKGYLFDKKYKNGKVNFSASSDVNLDLIKETLSADTTFSLANIEGKTSLRGQEVLKNLTLNGDMTVNSFNMNNFYETIGKTDSPIGYLALNSKFHFNNSTLTLNQLAAKVNDATISGNANLQLKSKAVNFDLAAQELDLNQFLPDNSSSSEENPKNDTASDTAKSKQTSDWHARGNIKIGKLKIKKIELSNLTTLISYKNDVIELSPLHADLYRGEANGNIIIDKRDQQKTFVYIKQFINSVDLKEMLQQTSDSQKLSGLANITANLNSVITAKTSFLSGLNGDLQLLIKNGALQGIDVTYQITRAHAFISKLSKTSLENSKETQFNELTASAQIHNGVLDNKDLIITSEYLKVNGKGSLNFDKKDINYSLKAFARPKLAQENQLEKEIISYEIPIKVSGNFAKPSVNVDFAELTKIIYQRKIQKPLQDHFGKNIENLKENLRSKIKEKLNSNILNKL